VKKSYRAKKGDHRVAETEEASGFEATKSHARWVGFQKGRINARNLPFIHKRALVLRKHDESFG